MACDAAGRWMRGTLRAQVRVRGFRTVRLGFLVTSRAPQNTPRAPGHFNGKMPFESHTAPPHYQIRTQGTLPGHRGLG